MEVTTREASAMTDSSVALSRSEPEPFDEAELPLLPADGAEVMVDEALLEVVGVGRRVPLAESTDEASAETEEPAEDTLEVAEAVMSLEVPLARAQILSAAVIMGNHSLQ